MNPFPGISNTVGLPAEEAIPRIVIYELLPQLEKLLLTLVGLQKKWNNPHSAIPSKIMEAAGAGQPLGGYSPADWVRWGETLLALNVFLATPIEIALPSGSTETVTPESILTASYTPVQA
jgi:hypothetical protein